MQNIQNAGIYLIIIVCLIAVIVFLADLLRKKNNDIEKIKLQLKEVEAVSEIKISSRTKELKEIANSLEEQVKERTKDLEEKIKSLEKIKKLSIGRELKMIELKKEIKLLEKQIIKLDFKDEESKANQ